MKIWCLSAVKTLCVQCLSGLRNSLQTSVPIQLDYRPKSPWKHQSQNSVIIHIKNRLCNVMLWAPHVWEVGTEWQVQRDQHNRGAQVSKRDVPIQQHKLSLKQRSVEAFSACPLMGVMSVPAVAPAEKPKIAVKGQGDERERSSSTVELAKACIMDWDSGVEDRSAKNHAMP